MSPLYIHGAKVSTIILRLKLDYAIALMDKRHLKIYYRRRTDIFNTRKVNNEVSKITIARPPS